MGTCMCIKSDPAAPFTVGMSRYQKYGELLRKYLGMIKNKNKKNYYIRPLQNNLILSFLL
jgi:hypothetical protein